MPSRTPSVISRWIFWASLFLLVLPISQAFQLGPCPKNLLSYALGEGLISASAKQQSKLLYASNNCKGDTSTHLLYSDIEWRLRPPEGTSRLDQLKIKLGANILRLESKLKGGKLPPVLCPRGGRALLEAYHKGKNSCKTPLRSSVIARIMLMHFSNRTWAQEEENCSIWLYHSKGSVVC
jgi:hypothetical protein